MMMGGKLLGVSGKVLVRGGSGGIAYHHPSTSKRLGGAREFLQIEHPSRECIDDRSADWP